MIGVNIVGLRNHAVSYLWIVFDAVYRHTQTAFNHINHFNMRMKMRGIDIVDQDIEFQAGILFSGIFK